MAEIPQLVDCTTVCVIGPVSSGKSYLLNRWLLSTERSVAVDVTASFMSDDFEHIWQDPLQLCDRLQANPYYYRIAYHPVGIVEDAWFACANAMWICDSPRWLVMDEVQRVCGQNNMTREAEIICQMSRHRLLGFIGAAQRLAEVNKTFTSASRMVVLFHTQEARDLDAVSDRWGDECATLVENLRPCIYDDAKKICYQEPQALVIMKGKGFKVFNLGDKILSPQERGELAQWEGHSAEQQQTPEASSLEHNSGNPEKKLSESTSEASKPRSE